MFENETNKRRNSKNAKSSVFCSLSLIAQRMPIAALILHHPRWKEYGMNTDDNNFEFARLCPNILATELLKMFFPE